MRRSIRISKLGMRSQNQENKATRHFRNV